MRMAKWSTVSFFGLGALLIGSIAAAGCSVSTTDPGPVVIDNPDIDSGTGADTSTTANVCPNNTRQTVVFAEACQTRLDLICCNEMINAFAVTPTDTSKPSDGNALITCIERCNFKTDGTTPCTTDADCSSSDGSACLRGADGTDKCELPEDDDNNFKDCKVLCQGEAEEDVLTPEQALEQCILGDSTAATECGELVRGD